MPPGRDGEVRVGNHIPGHIAASEGTSAEGLPWLADRFAGRTAPSTC
ncbi:hypothetical protein OG782_37170 (plasmid) [Streptomyces sp. NBC_00876]|nr:hypothetical protein OG782_37170 [Streptomyces sp. NBC_00876]